MGNDQAPAALPPLDEPRSDVGSFVLRFLVGTILVGLAGLTALTAPMLVMASDSCFVGDTRIICSAGGQRAVVYIPVLAAASSVLLTVRGLALRRPATVLAALCLLVLGWLAALILMGG
ncbi:hypothetical protein [Streptomyces sp. NPDC054786]